jgi:hypothetical protein
LLRRYILFVMVVLGLLLASRGVWLWSEVDTGTVIQNWIVPSSVIPGNAGKWTWGVGGDPGQEPNQWHFHVFFQANQTANVLLVWNLNQSVLFARNSSSMDESFDVVLPVSHEPWRWDWLIRNPYATALEVYNFTISHYSVRFPERQNGVIAIGVGAVIALVAGITLVYFERRGIRRR